jgi:uncharacterized protein (TIGR00725 family)
VTRRHIAVIGPGEPADPAILAAAHAVGTGLARAGCVLVCGGLGGVMEAACRGAKQAGGRTLGLLPGTDRAAANPYIDIAVPTGLGEARNALVVRAADAVVAVGGGWGTLSEIALAMRTGVPVIALDSWTVSDGTGAAVIGPTTVGDAEEAVRVALAAVPMRADEADEADEGR